MSFIKYSNDYLIDGSTTIQNIYISEYLPTLPDTINKIYIYGLYLCSHVDASDNTLVAMSGRLALDTAAIIGAYEYLQEVGLVHVLNKEPFEVRYLPIRIVSDLKKYNPAKYKDFNMQMQELLSERMISSNEYSEYYSLIEDAHIEPEALILIAKYATTLKSKNVGYPYILAIARNWASEGITTLERVEQKLIDYDTVTGDIAIVLHALASKRGVSYEDRELFLKWTRGLEFPLDTITYVAKSCKKGGMTRLDAKLTKYYEAKLYSVRDISAYEAEKDTLYGIAKAVNKTIGVYYEQLDNIVDTYIVVWMSMGFDEEALVFIANAAFRRGVRTLEKLDEHIKGFYKQGLVTVSAIDSHLGRLSASDVLIKDVFTACNYDGAVTSRARDSYRTWTYSWGFDQAVVLYAASLASSAAQPIAYINKVLSDWNAAGVKTLDAAKKVSQDRAASTSGKSKNDQTAATHNYSQDQLNALFDGIDEIKF